MYEIMTDEEINKKNELIIDEIVEKDKKRIRMKFINNFIKQNKREPGDEELLKIINQVNQIMYNNFINIEKDI